MSLQKTTYVSPNNDKMTLPVHAPFLPTLMHTCDYTFFSVRQAPEHNTKVHLFPWENLSANEAAGELADALLPVSLIHASQFALLMNYNLKSFVAATYLAIMSVFCLFS